MAERHPAFVVQTPYPQAKSVVCYVDTWAEHIAPNRHIGADTREATIRTLARPGAIVSGTTNSGYIAFVNTELLSRSSQSPFVVFVDPSGDPMPTVVTIGFRRDFRDLKGHTILWLPEPRQ